VAAQSGLRRSLARFLLSLAVAAAVGGAALLAGPPTAAATLSSDLTAILSSYGLGAASGVRVVEADSGRLLYAHDQTRLLTPASNTKIVTSSTALARWGADYRFRTELYVPPDPPDTGGVLRGNVYIKGYGDPTLSTRAYARNVLRRPAASIEDFVPALQAMGVTRIAGHIVGDESYFDSRRTVSSWSSGDWAYCGPISALSLNRGVVDGHRVGDPPHAVATKLTRLLEAAGIEVSGGPMTGRVPAGWLLRYTEYSPPLALVLRALNKPSDNFFAEMLTKGLGAAFRGSGTTAAGVKVEAAFLAESGIPATQFRLYDGSGLSHGNKLTAFAAARLLRVMARRADAGVYHDSLSIAGRDGTLARRMRGTPAAGNVYAKTGTLTGVSCLSGYVTAANGTRLIFSILMDRGGLNIAAAHAAQDAIAVTLARARP
jgi:D-alanyl-D-alanine carboxypeptidase/D-alanyl-D-alanine-endopeptidase (penicillin-binding protein 4)